MNTLAHRKFLHEEWGADGTPRTATIQQTRMGVHTVSYAIGEQVITAREWGTHDYAAQSAIDWIQDANIYGL